MYRSFLFSPEKLGQIMISAYAVTCYTNKFCHISTNSLIFILKADILHHHKGYDVLVLYHKRGERKGFDSFGTPGAARALLSEDSRVGHFIKTAYEKYMLSMIHACMPARKYYSFKIKFNLIV